MKINWSLETKSMFLNKKLGSILESTNCFLLSLCVFYMSVSTIQSQRPVYEEIFGGTRCEYHIRDGFPHSSVGKESACNAGDPSLIPG